MFLHDLQIGKQIKAPINQKISKKFFDPVDKETNYFKKRTAKVEHVKGIKDLGFILSS